MVGIRGIDGLMLPKEDCAAPSMEQFASSSSSVASELRETFRSSEGMPCSISKRAVGRRGRLLLRGGYDTGVLEKEPTS